MAIKGTATQGKIDSGFNIDEFRSIINKRGVARNNSYRINIFPPEPIRIATGVETKLLNEMTVFVESLPLPGVAFATREIRNETIGPVELRPYLPLFNRELTVNFVVDGEGNILDFFHNWMRCVINYSSSGSKFDQYTFNNAYPWEVSYKNEYAADILIDVLRNFSTDSSRKFDVIATYKLYGAYPVAIGEPTLSYSYQDTYLTVPIMFNYFDWEQEIKKTVSPNNISGVSTTQTDSFNTNIPNQSDQTGIVTGTTQGNIY